MLERERERETEMCVLERERERTGLNVRKICKRERERERRDLKKSFSGYVIKFFFRTKANRSLFTLFGRPI